MKDGHGNPLSARQEAEMRARKPPAEADAARQCAPSQAQPNKSGLVSANPAVSAWDGDATPGNGHGRDRSPEEASNGH